MTTPIDGYTDSTSVTVSGFRESDNLTFDKLLQAKEKTKKIMKLDLYYTTSEFLSEGEIFYISEGELHPEYFVCHPNDFETISSKLTISRTLMPLADYRPTKERLDKVFERLLGKIEESMDPRIIASRKMLAEMLKAALGV